MLNVELYKSAKAEATK